MAHSLIIVAKVSNQCKKVQIQCRILIEVYHFQPKIMTLKHISQKLSNFQTS